METGRLSSREFDAFVDQILNICADRTNEDLHEIYVRGALRRLLARHKSCLETRWCAQISRLEAQLAETRNLLESEAEAAADAARQRLEAENEVNLLWHDCRNFGDLNSTLPPQRHCHDLPQRPYCEVGAESPSILPPQRQYHDLQSSAAGKENIGVMSLSPTSKSGPAMNESISSECPRREVRRALTAQLVQRSPLQPQVLARSLSPNRDMVPMPSSQCSAAIRLASPGPDMGLQNPRSSPRGCAAQPNMNPRSSPVRKSGGLNTGSFAPARKPSANPQGTVPQGAGNSFAPPGIMSSAPHLLRPGGPHQYMAIDRMVRAQSQVIRVPSSHAVS